VSVLDRKLLRDLLRMWAQVLAIALVMACGVATIVIAVGGYRSLEQTREAFYDASSRRSWIWLKSPQRRCESRSERKE
jgi:hypothetical protein